ncbi:MAG: hypothetical protein JO110_07855, partial [Acetobacteraceae bacterium]|nr:hypothetical protein [Acetobacteraceae bacterium]
QCFFQGGNTTLANALGVARSNLAEQAAAVPSEERRGPKPQPESELLAIKEIIAAMPTYGYRRVHALAAASILY